MTYLKFIQHKKEPTRSCLKLSKNFFDEQLFKLWNFLQELLSAPTSLIKCKLGAVEKEGERVIKHLKGEKGLESVPEFLLDFNWAAKRFSARKLAHNIKV